MQKYLQKFKFLILVALVASGTLSAQAAQNSLIEVVESTPIETNLAVPGVRATQGVWLEMIKAAKSSIDLEQFYIYNKAGESLEPVLNAIRDAAARGVKVRFIVDSKFMKTYPQEPNNFAALDNVEVRVIDFGDGIQHAKFLIVDGVNTYLGSANFDWLALSHIHEVGLRIKDKDTAQSLGTVFSKDFQMAKALKLAAASSERAADAARPSSALPDLELVASPPQQNPEGITDTLSELTKLMGSARGSLKLQMYQYSTMKSSGKGKWLNLDNALRQAAKRGVKVQLLIDSVSLKKASAELKALAALDNVEVRMVQIPEWSGGHLDYARLVHSKYLTVDGSAAWVGTENWSEGYFTDSRNVGIILHSDEITGQLDQVYDRLWNSDYVNKL